VVSWRTGHFLHFDATPLSHITFQTSTPSLQRFPDTGRVRHLVDRQFIPPACPANGQAIAACESRNTGKSLAAALNDEIPAVADAARFLAAVAGAPHGW
jgi:hypothetical protein